MTLKNKTLNIRPTTQYKRDLKKAIKQRKNLTLLENIISQLQCGHALAAKHRDHFLGGNWHGHRECHLTPDWLLIYKISENELLLLRMESHAELFE